MAEVALRVRDLEVVFEGRRGTARVLEGVSFDVTSGETVGIVGESGSGKTVLARAVTRLLPTTANVTGSVLLGSAGAADLLRVSERDLRLVRGARIAMVFQDHATSLNPVRTIGSQLAESVRQHQRLGAADMRRRVVGLLEEVGIPDPGRRVGQYPHELSGGMRQRVVIAMALSCSPELLIADEPTTALDVTVQRSILDLLDRLRRDRAMSLILITHDLEVARERCDHLVVLYAGRVAEEGPVDHVVERTRHPYTHALLAATPTMATPPGSQLVPIPGQVPDPSDRGDHCVFADRCPNAGDRCGRERPGWTTAAGSHRYRCFNPVGITPDQEAHDGR